MALSVEAHRWFVTIMCSPNHRILQTVAKSANSGDSYYYYYTHQQRCRDEEKYIETKHIIISMISN